MSFKEYLNESNNKKLEEKLLSDFSKISKNITKVGIYPDDRLADLEVRFTGSSKDDILSEISKIISKVENIIKKNVYKVHWKADKSSYSMMANDKGIHIGVLFKVTL